MHISSALFKLYENVTGDDGDIWTIV